jgi:O-antigen ligase
VFHFAELTALAGLAAMATRRLKAGLPVAKINTEVIAVIALGGIILFSVPFSFWPGGSLHVFTDTYVKVSLIFTLMVATLTSPKRLEHVTWIILIACGYIAARAVFDYVRGVNLVEGGRVRGAVGGMFDNPNDLALNLVTFMAPALIIVLQDRRAARRLVAGAIAFAMFAAIVCTKSRGGFLGLIAMCLTVGVFTIRVKPGLAAVAALCGLLALPALPQSFWTRMDSIVNASEDPTGSRAARLRLMTQAVQVFAENPITGIGAGQFKNYNESSITVEKWRVTHNVWLEVAAELGVFGLATFLFLVLRGYRACFATLRLLRPRQRKRRQKQTPLPGLDESDRRLIDMNAKSLLAALVGWTVCASFASVAFSWTFYYLLAMAVAGRDIARAAQGADATAAAPVVSSTAGLVRAHA